MSPQEGKSQRASRRFPLWCLTQNNELGIAITSYESNVARGWGCAIRDDITTHGKELDLAAQHERALEGHEGGVYTAGIGGALTGRPVDLRIIDDPIKDREQADADTYRERAWDWWTDPALTCLTPWAPVILILTRWHADDLAGGLLAAEDGKDWKVINIPADADHRPKKGETGTLGRTSGEFMESARRRTLTQRAALTRHQAKLPAGRVRHAPHKREPYVRAQLPQFGTVDAKAAAWTQTQVFLHWIDENGKAHNEWVLAVRVQRIARAEPEWQDPYDEVRVHGLWKI